MGSAAPPPPPSSASPPATTDLELVLGSATDADRFGEWYDRRLADVLAYHLRRTRCPQTAADLTAETFAAAFTARRAFRDVGAPADAWLFTIARRQLGRYLRREAVATRARRRLGVDVPPLDHDDVERIDALVDRAEQAAQLAEALASLPGGLADAVQLRVGMDLPYPEVAARLGCTEGAARVRVSRALTRLADQLGGTR